jgi:hypothetical protein
MTFRVLLGAVQVLLLSLLTAVVEGAEPRDGGTPWA